MSFDIKFTRQGFENACWHREACRAIQHAFSKASLVNLISKDANLVFYVSVYPLLNTLQSSDYDVFFLFLLIQRHWRRHSKSATSSWPDKGNMPWDRKRLSGYVETIQLILGVNDKMTIAIVLTLQEVPWKYYYYCELPLRYLCDSLGLSNTLFLKQDTKNSLFLCTT